jgi:hypothetical protein
MKKFGEGRKPTEYSVFSISNDCRNFYAHKYEQVFEYARLLYSALRLGDSQGIREIAVIAPIGEGLAVAIRDRLLRASRGR